MSSLSTKHTLDVQEDIGRERINPHILVLRSDLVTGKLLNSFLGPAEKRTH